MTLDGLVSEPGFLLARGPAALLPEIDTVVDPQARAAARAYRRAAAYLRDPPEEAAAALHLAAHRTGVEWLADRIGFRGGLAWSTLWIRGDEEDPHRTLATVHGVVESVWAAPDQVGAVSRAGHYGVWAIADGAPVVSGTFGRPGRFAGMATGGRHLIAQVTAGDGDGPDAIVLWEATPGSPTELDRIPAPRRVSSLHATAGVFVADALHWWTVDGDRLREQEPLVAPGHGRVVGAGADGDGRPIVVRANPVLGGDTIALVTAATTRLQPTDTRRLLDARTGTAGHIAGEDLVVTAGVRGGFRFYEQATGVERTDRVSRRNHHAASAVVHAGHLICGGADGVVRVWHPSTWTTTDAPETTTTDAVMSDPATSLSTPVAAACARLAGGRRVAVVGHDNGVVGVWELDEWGPPQQALHPDHAAVAVACVATPAGDTLAVTADLGGRVRVTEVDTGRVRHEWTTPPAEPLPGTGEMHPVGVTPQTDRPEPVRGLAVGDTDDGPIAVGVGDRGWLHRWHVTRGESLGALPLGGRGMAVACGRHDGRPVAVATTGQDLQIYDLVAPAAPTVDHRVLRDDTIWALTLADGIVAALDGSGRLHRWDLGTGEARGHPLSAHHSDARAIGHGRLPDGRPIVVTGGWDGKVLVWDLASGERLHRIPVEEPVRTVAVADNLAILVGFDRGIAAFRIETG